MRRDLPADLEDNMRTFVMKTEPNDFSIADLKTRGREPWTGVRNYQARNLIRDRMRVGDRALIYHSNCKVPGIYGEAMIVAAASPDPTQFNPESCYFDPRATVDAPRWIAVEVGFVRELKEPVPLATIRQHAAEIGDCELLRRGSRLSVSEIQPSQYRLMLGLGSAPSRGKRR